MGINYLIDNCICKVGNLQHAYITGNLAEGINSDFIELALVGSGLDNECIGKIIKSVQKLLDRKIMYLTFTGEQMDYFFKDKPHLLIWSANKKKTINHIHPVTGYQTVENPLLNASTLKNQINIKTRNENFSDRLCRVHWLSSCKKTP